MRSFVTETCFCPGPSDMFVLLSEMVTELSKRCVTYITHIKIMPYRGLSIVCILKASTDLCTAGEGSLRDFRCVHIFIDEYASNQGGNMDENQTAAGARSLKCFKC